MKILFLILALAAPSFASMPGCTTGGAPLYLQIPNHGASGDQFSNCLNYDFGYLSTSAWASYGGILSASSTFTGANVFASTANVFHGDGSALTGIKTDLSGYFSSTGTLPFAQLASSSTLALRSEVSASTLTLTNRANGFNLGLSTAVSTSGSYSNPTWLTSLASSKLTGSISPSLVDLSTVSILNSSNTFTGRSTFNGINNLGTSTATLFYGDGSALTGIKTDLSNYFASTNTLPFSQLGSSATLALSANVIPSSATGNYSLIASSANYAAMAGNVITGSTFTVLAFATGGDVFYASTTFEANMGMVYAIDQSTVNITGFNCYVVAESTVAGVSFNIAFSTSVGQTTTYSYLNSSAITVSTTSKYSGWVSPSDTVRSYVSNLPAWLSLHTTSIPGSGTLQSGYGCLMRFWRRIDQ